MSSPSIPGVSPAPLLSDLVKVVVYDSGGEEFERRVVYGGGGGFPEGPEMDQVLSRVAKGGEHGAVCGEGGVFTGGEAEGREQVLGGDALWAELEAARQREDWLANKAASGCTGILCWVREHWVLLDSASTAFTSIQDGLMQGSTVQPSELQQGMARLERLLAEHWRHNVVAPGLWWELAVDAGEALLGLAEVLAVVQAQMEVNLGIGLPGDLGRE
ncbi:hypothetical protein E4T56_gene922 [Termitomyces sp. T112]|nr:hypothetical protein E4T56_gene922 [Termitomyces sp. T112]